MNLMNECLNHQRKLASLMPVGFFVLRSTWDVAVAKAANNRSRRLHGSQHASTFGTTLKSLNLGLRTGLYLAPANVEAWRFACFWGNSGEKVGNKEYKAERLGEARRHDRSLKEQDHHVMKIFQCSELWTGLHLAMWHVHTATTWLTWRTWLTCTTALQDITGHTSEPACASSSPCAKIRENQAIHCWRLFLFTVELRKSPIDQDARKW